MLSLIYKMHSNHKISDSASFNELRHYSKMQIETFEHWARRLIDECLRTEYGDDYLDEEYSIAWSVCINETKTVKNGKGCKIEIDFTNDMVSFSHRVEVKLITNKSWRRFGSIECDDYVIIDLSQVLPPIEDMY